jgi:hypothetical protein
MKAIMLQKILEVKDRHLAMAEQSLKAETAAEEAEAEAGAPLEGKRLADLALEMQIGIIFKTLQLQNTTCLS